MQFKVFTCYLFLQCSHIQATEEVQITVLKRITFRCLCWT